MEELQQTILDAVSKMHDLMADRTGISEEDVKIDIAIANTTSQLAKAYVASMALQYKIGNAQTENKIMLEEVL